MTCGSLPTTSGNRGAGALRNDGAMKTHAVSRCGGGAARAPHHPFAGAGRMDVRTVLLVLWSSGCAPRFTVAASCTTPARVTVLQEQERGCAYYEDMVNDAAAGLVAAGFATNEEVARVFGERDVWVRADPEPFACGHALKAWGCYHPEDEAIELTADATSMLHEMLHRLEHARGGPPDSHRGWESRGAAPGAPEVVLPTKQRVLQGSWMEVSDTFARRWWRLGRWGL